MAVESSVATTRRVPRVDTVRFALAALVVVLLAGALAFVAYRLAMPSDGTKVGGEGNPYAPGGVTVTPSTGHAGATAIASGDRVVAVFERPIDDWVGLLLDPTVTRPTVAVGEAIDYTVERDGRPIKLTVAAAPFDGLAGLAEDWGVVVLALAVQIVGLYLFARRPDEPAARALLVTGTGMFASTVPWALGLQVSDIAHATGFWLHAATTGVAYALFWCGALHFALVFPRPHSFVAGRGRIAVIAYGLPLGALVAWVVGAGLASARILPAIQAWLTGQSVLEIVVTISAIVLMSYSYWRHVDQTSRRQLRLVAGAVGLAGLTALLLWFGPQALLGAPLIPRSAVALLGLPFPVALMLAINRHHLFNIDAALNRSLVYVGLTAGVVVTYAGTVALLGSFIPGNAPFAIALLGAGAVAVVAFPLHARLQRSVNHLLYGDRDEPDQALRRLGRRLEASLDPQTVLSTLVETMAEALRSPYVAIELEHDGEPRVEAASGTEPANQGGTGELVRLPIVYRGRPVGRLVLSPRAADEPFSAADERLLTDLARQAAPAVEGVRLTADLRRSREELIATREEERRRLRRDLHDELGPAMAGSLMKLRAARSMMVSEPSRASTLLDDLETDVRGMIGEIRQIAHNLRPPALDELGLLGVLRMQIAAFDEGPHDRQLQVSLDAPDELPPLPAAVEVAGLRIALEGLTNAARHSGASHAQVRLAMDGDSLVVAVTDDGTGIPGNVSPGVGLASMRERADELGGTLQLESQRGQGTTVIARLPVAPIGPA
jgi:two-component system, NarL family, sensor kinase